MIVARTWLAALPLLFASTALAAQTASPQAASAQVSPQSAAPLTPPAASTQTAPVPPPSAAAPTEAPPAPTADDTSQAIAPAPAPAVDATPPLPPECLQIATDSAQDTPAGYSANKYVATLPNTPVTLTITQAQVSDTAHRLTPDQLHQIEALSALGALSAILGRTPGPCQGGEVAAVTHQLSAAIEAGAMPHVSWHGIQLQHGPNSLTANAADAGLSPEPTTHLLRLNVTADGIADSEPGAVIPSQFAADLAAPGSAITSLGAQGVPFPVIVHGLRATVSLPNGAVTLNASGRATIAPDPHDTNADGHVAVTNLAGLIEATRRSGPSVATTALSVGQLVGHRSGDETSWEIKYADNLVIINNIPLPIGVH